MTSSARTTRRWVRSMNVLHASILSATGGTLDLDFAAWSATFNGLACGLVSPRAAMAASNLFFHDEDKGSVTLLDGALKLMHLT